MKEQVERFRLVMKKVSSIKKILEGMNAIAEEDGSVTEDELAILNSINYHFESYVDLLDTVLKDNMITDDEMERLHSYEKKIVQMASSEALSDGVISRDERRLLDALISHMEEIQEL